MEIYKQIVWIQCRVHIRMLWVAVMPGLDVGKKLESWKSDVWSEIDRSTSTGKTSEMDSFQIWPRKVFFFYNICDTFMLKIGRECKPGWTNHLQRELLPSWGAFVFMFGCLCIYLYFLKSLCIYDWMPSKDTSWDPYLYSTKENI